jgi:hypothetical protein
MAPASARRGESLMRREQWQEQKKLARLLDK